MERMLINAIQPEEIRVALVRDDKLFDLDIEKPSDINKKANIYKGRITRIEPSLEAAFVDYGAKRQGFLPLKEISPEYFKKKPNNPNNDGEQPKPSIKSLLSEGQELMVQVEKEERGNKGAALTTYITLAGCYLVLMPNNADAGGISRRIEGGDREEIKNILNALTIPEEMGLIVRTAGVGKDVEEIRWDLTFLINQWIAIQKAFKKQPAPFLIHQEGDVVIRSIRDNLRRTVKEIIIDSSEAYIKAKRFIEQVKPDFLANVHLYNDNVPLFSRYQLESQIESAYQREVRLPSGGALVIDTTEALISIDINSAKSTSGADIETTAVSTNLEAANEIARQLRLRDLGGLVVIDFIDMTSSNHQRQVENELKEALKVDRARTQVGRISRFGLLEMSRQRLRMSLSENNQEPCPYCHGHGVVRSAYSHSLSMLRLIEEEALKPNVVEVHAELPIQIATFLLNEKREMVINMGKQHQVEIIILPNPHFEISDTSITHITGEKKRKKASYDLITEPELKAIKNQDTQTQNHQKPAIRMEHQQKAQPESKEKMDSLFIRLWKSLFGSEADGEKEKNPKHQKGGHSRGRHHSRRHHSNNRNRNQHHRKRHHNHNNNNSSNNNNNNNNNSGNNNQQRSNQNRNQVSGNAAKGQRHHNQKHHHNKKERTPSE